MTGQNLFKNKIVMLGLLLACLGLNSPMIAKLGSNSQGSATLASSESSNSLDEGCTYEEEKTQTELLRESIFIDSSQYKLDNGFKDNENNFTITNNNSRSSGQNRNNIKLTFKYKKVVCRTGNNGTKKSNGEYKITDVEVDTEGSVEIPCKHCLALNNSLDLSDIENFADIAEKLAEEQIGRDISKQLELAQFLKKQDAREKNCVGKLNELKSENKTTYDFYVYTKSIEDKQKKLECLIKKANLTEDESLLVKLYEDSIEPLLHSLSQGGVEDREMALENIKELGVNEMPISIQASAKSIALYIIQYNNIKEAHDPYQKEKLRLAQSRCNIQRQHTYFQNCLSEIEYQIRLNQLNKNFDYEMQYVRTLGTMDINKFNNEFGSTGDQYQLSPYLIRLDEEFSRHLDQIRFTYGIDEIEKQTETNPRVAADQSDFSNPTSRISTNLGVSSLHSGNGIFGNTQISSSLSGLRPTLEKPTRGH